MNKIHFEIDCDSVIKYTPMPEIDENTYKTEIVMTKEIFQECYKKWIEEHEIDDFIKFAKEQYGVELVAKKSNDPDTFEKIFE